MKKILWIIATLLGVAYMVASLIWADKDAASETCRGMLIKINDTTESRFVSDAVIIRELDSLPLRCDGMLMSEIDIDSIEQVLNGIDKIETALCVKRNDGIIEVQITPMRPVARVFDNGESYYINRQGKYISADARYYINVPVISGNFDSTFMAIDLLPLLDFIYSDSVWAQLITMIKVDSPSDIILVPSMYGHVINVGDMSDLPGKFKRLKHMYQSVLPVKGWNIYDTLSLKWNRQVVTSKRKKVLGKLDVDIIDLSENEAGDASTMLTQENSDTITFKNYKSSFNQ